MKQYIYLTLAVLGLAFASSCGRQIEFEHMSFATFESGTYSFDENAGEVTIPVTIYNPSNSEVQVSVKAIDGKAKSGVDFEIVSPMSGILTFAAGEETQDVTIAITDFPGELTGSKTFTLQIASATEGFQVGTFNSANVKIKDLDHPLKDFIGVWSASTVGMYQGGLSFSWEMTIDGDEEDYTTLVVSDMCPFSYTYLGLKSADGFNIVEAVSNAEKTQLIIEDDQYLGVYEADATTTYDISLRGVDESGKYLDDIYLVLQSDGTLVAPNMWGAYVSAGGFFEAYPPGVVFTRK